MIVQELHEETRNWYEREQLVQAELQDTWDHSVEYKLSRFLSRQKKRKPTLEEALQKRLCRSVHY